MSKFFVKETFEVLGRQLFALCGRLVEGEISTRMYMSVMYNSVVQIKARIHSVEYGNKTDEGADLCLYLEMEPKMLPVWSKLKIKNTTLEVKPSHSAKNCQANPKRPGSLFVRHYETSFTIKVRSVNTNQ